MGITTNAILCYGVSVKEGTEFPWGDDSEYFGDWWLEQCGLDWGGNYKLRRELLAEYRPPVIPVLHCSGDCPMYILAIPRTELTASRGYPQEILNKTVPLDPNEVMRLIEFCQKYQIQGFLGWWLCSLYLK